MCPTCLLKYLIRISNENSNMKNLFALFTIFGIVTCNNVVRMSIGHSEEDYFLVNKKDKDGNGNQKFGMAKVFQSHMLLQRAPAKAIVYGVASSDDVGKEVTLEMSKSGSAVSYTTTVFQSSNSPDTGIWNVTLDPMPANATVSITAKLSSNSQTIDDVIFGDVWLCGGSDNMQMTVSMMEGGADELADAHNHPNIRLMTIGQKASSTPLDDLKKIEQDWSRPSNESLGGKDWDYFSAICWIYGKKLHKELDIPIGLVSVAWRGTAIDVWSSPDAISECGSNSTEDVTFNDEVDDQEEIESQVYNEADEIVESMVTVPGGGASQAWNAMIHPLTPLTIYGVVWYQGEADSKKDIRARYNCTFLSLITDWRDKFSSASGQTHKEFPFGFVQLAPNRNNTHNVGFPEIRWHQTADKGYVPNRMLENVFMAVAMDLPDLESPFNSIHPRDKLDVGLRLAQSGLGIAYGSNCIFQGPFPYTGAPAGDLLNISFTGEITVKAQTGFEWFCQPKGKWVATSIVHSNSTSVSLNATTCPHKSKIAGVRYAWSESPCEFKKCAIYGVADLTLPAPPFILALDDGSTDVAMEFDTPLDDDSMDVAMEFDTPIGRGGITFRET